MKNMVKISMLLSLVVVMAGCQKTTTTKKKSTSTTVTNPVTDTSTDTGSGTTVSGCNGVYRSGATRCYYTGLAKITLNGSGANASAIGPVLWSSRTSVSSTYSQNTFRSDATFSVRIKGQYPYANEVTRQGKVCSSSMMNNFTKVKVFLMLRRSIDSIAEYQELTASVNAYSSKIYFDLPGGTDDPYILEVVGIQTDHRCNTAYGSLTTAQKSACTAGTYFSDIPLNTGGPTSCAGFNIEYATDSTYDLPN